VPERGRVCVAVVVNAKSQRRDVAKNEGRKARSIWDARGLVSVISSTVSLFAIDLRRSSRGGAEFAALPPFFVNGEAVSQINSEVK
jgi:hypothetical protein